MCETVVNVFLNKYLLSQGISFPTCISVNNVVCHYSPLAADPDTVLADGDLVKIDLGAHIDGFIAVVGHSLVVGASSESQVSGRRADVMMAAHLASEAALRSFRPGNNNMQLTDKIVRIARDFGCRVRCVTRWIWSVTLFLSARGEVEVL